MEKNIDNKPIYELCIDEKEKLLNENQKLLNENQKKQEKMNELINELKSYNIQNVYLKNTPKNKPKIIKNYYVLYY
jgi:predicted nuclease with TOPRIM domain